MFVNGEEVSRPADQQLRQMIYSTLEDFDLLEPQWRMLESDLGSSLLPFQTFAWNRAWWKVFNSQAFPRRDKLSIIAFYDGIRLVAVVPLFETGVGVGNWRPLRYLRPFGADANLTELRIPLALPEHLSAVFDHLLNFMSLAKDAPLALQLIGPAAAIENAAKRHPNLINIHSRTVTNHILTLETDWENFRTKLKRNIKESLRRCYNSLARAGLTQELQVFTNSEDITARLAIFYRLHALRARSTKSSIDHPDYFSAPRHRLFIESMLAGLRADGEHQPHLFCLIVNEEIVAIRMGFLSGTDLYFYYSGYEPAYSRFSVMTTLVAESLQWCITRGITRVNLSVGTDVSKTRWGPDVATYQEAIFVNRGLQKNVVAHLIYLTKLKRTVRKMSAGFVTALQNNHPRTKDQVTPTIK